MSVTIKVESPPTQVVRVGPARDASPAQVSDIDRVLNAITIDTSPRSGFRLTARRAAGSLSIGLTGSPTGVYTQSAIATVSKAQLRALPSARVELIPAISASSAVQPRGIRIEKTGNATDSDERFQTVLGHRNKFTHVLAIAAVGTAGGDIPAFEADTPGDDSFGEHGVWAFSSSFGSFGDPRFLEVNGFLLRNSFDFYSSIAAVSLYADRGWTLCYIKLGGGTVAEAATEWEELVDASPADLELRFVLEYAPHIVV